jgi:hypothetical protein
VLAKAPSDIEVMGMPEASAHNLLSFSGFLVGLQVGRSSVSRRRVLALSIRFADGPLSRHTASLTLATAVPLTLAAGVGPV